MATPFRLKRSAVADRRPTTTDLQLGELALNTHDGFLYAETTGVGSTVSLLTPWREQYGSPTSIYYNHRVGIGSTNPTVSLDVVGDTKLQNNLSVTGLSTFSEGIFIPDDKKIEIGNAAGSGDLQLFYDSTPGESFISHTGTGVFKIQGNGSNNTFLRAKEAENSVTLVPNGGVILHYDGGVRAETTKTGFDITNTLKVAGVSTFIDTVNVNGVIEANSNVNVDGNLDVDGNTELDDVNVSGNLSVAEKIIHAGDTDSFIKFTDNQIDIQTNAANKVRIGAGASIGIHDDAIRALTIGTGNQNNVLIRPNNGASNGMGNSDAVNNLIVMRVPYGENPASQTNAGMRVGMMMRLFNGNSGFGDIDPAKSAALYAVSEDAGKGYSRVVGLSFYTSAFNSSQTEKLRISGSGNVGIGTTLPKQTLEVFSGAAGRPTFRHTGGFGGLQIAGPQSGSGAALMFTRSYDVVGGGTTTYSLLMGGGTQALHFISGDPSEHETKTRLFLSSIGNVGINTSNPRQKLHLDNGVMFIRGDTAPSLRINAAINDTSSTRLMFGLATGANNFFNGSSALDACLSAPSTGRLLLGVGVNSRMYILNSGDITINRGSQLGNAKLSLQCDSGQEEGIAVNLNQSSGISTAFAIWNTGGEIFNLAQDTDSTPDLIFKIKGSGESAPVEKVRFASDGKVGIGTDNPDTLLHVFGSTATQKLITLTGSNKRNNYIGVFQNDNLEIGADEDGQGGDSSIRFRVDGSEKVRIESSGDVGIGTDNAISKLHVGGKLAVITQSILTDQNHTNAARGGNALFVSNNSTVETARFYCSAAGNTKIHIECSSNNGDSELHFCDQEDRTTGGTFHYEKSSGKIIYEHDKDAFKFDTNRTEKLRIMSSGDVGIGTNNPTGSNALTSNTAVLAVGIVTTNSLFSRDLKVSGISTFAGITTVTGETFFTKQLNVSGISTFVGNAQFDGRVLVGTTTEGHANADDLTIASSGDTGITIRSGTSSFGSLFFSDGTSGADELEGAIEYSHNGDFMKFRTGASERLRITSDGDVGIGDQNPDSRLHVTSSDNVVATFERSGNSDGARIAFVDRYTFGSPAYVEGYNGELHLGASGSRMMVFSSANDGRIGIGTVNNTDQFLTIQGSANVDGDFKVTGVSTFSGQVGFGTHITLEDYGQIQLGEKSGGDFFIGHNPTLYSGVYNTLVSTNGNILLENRDTGGQTRNLYLKANAVQIRSYTGNESFITANLNQDVKIFYDNSERFATTTYGALLTGGASGIGTLAAPAIFHIDPAAVGDNTGTVVIKGNLQIDGTTTTVNSTTVTVDDKNLVLASGAANDAAASGGGITIESGDGNKTFTFESTGNGFQSSEHFRVASGKVIGFAAHMGTYLSASASGGFVFSIGNNEKARIRSSGDVNLGANLNVVGVSTFTGKVAISTFATGGELADTHLLVKGGVTFSEFTSSGEGHLPAITQFSETGSQDLAIGTRSSGGDLLFFTGNVNSGTANFGTNLNKLRLRISHDGEATFSKTVGISSNLNVSGITTLSSNLNATGITTLSGNVTLNAGASSLMQLKFKNNITGFGANDGAAVAYSTNSHGLFFSAFETAGSMIFQTGANNVNNYTLLIGNTGVVTLRRNQKNMLVATPNSHVKLYFDGEERLETTNTGVGISSNLTVSGISTFSDDIFANGQVAIGTDIVPSYGNLFVGVHTNTNAYNSSPTVRFAIENASSPHGDASSIHFGQRAGGSSDPSIIFHRRSGDVAWKSWAARIYQGSLDSFKFGFASAALPGSHSFSDEMVIKRNIGVGIGTHTPRRALDVIGDSVLEGNLNVTGISTFSDTVKIGTGVTALTDGNVSIGGTLELFNTTGNASNNPSEIKISNFTISQHNNTGTYKLNNSSFGGEILLSAGGGGFGGLSFWNSNFSRLYFQARDQGSVSLYYNNTVRFKTSGIGATVYGQLDSTQLNISGVSTFVDNIFIGVGATVGFGSTAYFRDNAKAIFGDGEDLSLYHTGSQSYIQETGQGNLTLDTNGFAIKLTYNDSENMLRAIRNGAVELYYDNERKLSTSGLGVTVYNQLDTTNLNVSGIGTIGSGGSGYAELQYQGVKKLETTSGGVDVFNIVRCLGGTAPRIQFFGDVNGVDTNTRATFGLATGANHIVSGSTTNDVVLNTPHRFIIGHATNEIMARFDPDGAAELYFDAVKRLETTDTGVGISSNLTVSGVSTFQDDVTLSKNNPTITLSDTNNNPDYQIGNINGALRFQDTTNDKTKFIANTNGRVGINTHNPLRDFHVVGTSRFEQIDAIGFSTFATGTRFFHHTPRIEMQGNATATIGFFNATTGTTNNDGMLMGFSSSSAAGFINVNESNHGFVIKTGSSAQSSERLRISGVGTFSIRNGTEEMVNARPNLGVELYFNGNKRLETTDTGVDITDNLKVVGVSTFSGLVNINVNASQSTSTPLLLQNSAAAGTLSNPDVVKLAFGSQGTVKASIRADVYGNGNLTFHTNNDSEKVRITAGGNVGINSTAPTSKLDVDGDVKVSGITTSTGVINSQTDIRINNVSVIETALNDAVAMAIALG